MSVLGDLGRGIAGHRIAQALRHRDFRIYAFYYWISASGYWVQKIAMGWLTWELTHSGTWLGIVAMADAIPLILLITFAGTISDRFDRLRIFRITQALQGVSAVILAAMTWTGFVNEYWIAAISVLNGTINAIAMPARLTMAPGLVPPADRGAAVSMNSVLFQTSTFVGPALGGLVLTQLGAGWSFMLNGLSFFMFAASMYFVTLLYEPRPQRPSRGLFTETWEGIHHAATNGSIRPMLLIVLASAMLTRPYLELMPGFADVIFGRGPDGLATLVTVSGIGGLVGGFYMAQYNRTQGMTALVLGSLLAMALALLAFAGTPSFWLANLWVAIIAASLTIASTGAQVLIQTSVADEMRGRVMSLYALTWRGAPALGALAIGSISSWFGLQIPVAGAAILCLIAWGLVMPARRRMADGLERPAES